MLQDQERKNFETILLSEFYGAVGYMERICYALSEIDNLQHLESLKTLAPEFCQDMNQLIQEEVLNEHWQESNLIQETKLRPVKNIKNQLNLAKDLLSSICKLSLNREQTLHSMTEAINLIYEYCYHLHEILIEHSDLEVPFPRLNLIEIRNEFDLYDSDQAQNEEQEIDFEQQGPVCFFLDPQRVKDFLIHSKSEDQASKSGTAPYSTIGSLETKRSERYEYFINLGHVAMYEKKHEKALENFNQALKIKETAEILTLIGWTHSLLGDYSQAKSFCLKAIRKNPEYGAPYNDLGTYLLSEGEIEESLRWFELAKKSSEYQSREYPYINAGRAYMAQKNYPKALEEFNHALQLVPYNEQLQKTIDKLKKTLCTSKVRKKFHESLNNEKFTPPTH